jgi:hypothetical protein
VQKFKTILVLKNSETHFKKFMAKIVLSSIMQLEAGATKFFVNLSYFKILREH